ncbi:hypothetical protein FNV43_RR26682 [Rhamnella rubrinervis]|uniref:Uncharacterized protein n=1 Tax=Rhamnella rubrinervis TaxID=2594499 RepID=A0A8K0DK66_9ROSA|nr:hypothetical protein FNV43_RR26682 [Rhamnella rubrinervis]
MCMQVAADAPTRDGDALVCDERGSTERAIEVEVVQPAIEAVLVEDVTAREHANLVSVLQSAEANDAIGGVAVIVAMVIVGVSVGEEPVEVELVGEDNQTGETRAYGARKTVVDDDVVRIEGSREAKGVKEAKEDGTEVVNAVGDECYEQEWDRIRRHVVHLGLENKKEEEEEEAGIGVGAWRWWVNKEGM